MWAALRVACRLRCSAVVRRIFWLECFDAERVIGHPIGLDYIWARRLAVDSACARGQSSEAQQTH